MALQMNGSRLVGVSPVQLGSFAEVVARRATIRVRYSSRSPVAYASRFIPIMETLPVFLQDDIASMQAYRLNRKIHGWEGNLKRKLTPTELSELRAQVYAPVRCTIIDIGRTLELVMPPQAFGGGKRFGLGTISSIVIHNAPPRPR